MPRRRQPSTSSSSDELEDGEPAASGNAEAPTTSQAAKPVPNYPKFRSSRLPSTYSGARNVVNPFLHLPKRKDRQRDAAAGVKSSPRSGRRSQSHSTPLKFSPGQHIVVSDSDDDDEEDGRRAQHPSESPSRSRSNGKADKSSRSAQKKRAVSREEASSHSAGPSRNKDREDSAALEAGPSSDAHTKRKADAIGNAEGSDASTSNVRKTNTARRSRLPMRLQSDSLGGPSRQQVKKPTFRPLAQRAADFEQEERDETRKQNENALSKAAEIAARSTVGKDRIATRSPLTTAPKALFNMDEDDDDDSVARTPSAAPGSAKKAARTQDDDVASPAQETEATTDLQADDHDTGTAAFDMFFDFGPGDNHSAEEAAVEQVTAAEPALEGGRESLPPMADDEAGASAGKARHDTAPSNLRQAIDAAEDHWLRKLEELRVSQAADVAILRTEMQSSLKELRQQLVTTDKA